MLCELHIRNVNLTDSHDYKKLELQEVTHFQFFVHPVALVLDRLSVLEFTELFCLHSCVIVCFDSRVSLQMFGAAISY